MNGMKRRGLVAGVLTGAFAVGFLLVGCGGSSGGGDGSPNPTPSPTPTAAPINYTRAYTTGVKPYFGDVNRDTPVTIEGVGFLSMTQGSRRMVITVTGNDTVRDLVIIDDTHATGVMPAHPGDPQFTDSVNSQGTVPVRVYVCDDNGCTLNPDAPTSDFNARYPAALFSYVKTQAE